MDRRSDAPIVSQSVSTINGKVQDSAELVPRCAKIADRVGVSAFVSWVKWRLVPFSLSLDIGRRLCTRLVVDRPAPVASSIR
jgi:hypothetical protein